MHRAEYNRDCLSELHADTSIACDERTRGTLQLLRTHEQLDGTAEDMKVLRHFGAPFELLERALGSYSPALLRPVCIRIPLYAGKDYSITLPVTAARHAAGSTLMDETHKVAVTRLGARIRAGGAAERPGDSLSLREAPRQTRSHVLTALFPRGGDLSRAECWTELKPMMLDGTPVISPTPCDNLYLSTDHSTLAWTMTAGTDGLLADRLSGGNPEIDPERLSMASYANVFVGARAH